jgi:hypothetical protein
MKCLGHLCAAAVIVALWMTPAGASSVVFSGTGANPAAIQASVDAFRGALGPLNPNVAGSFGIGRREINWDGVPDAAASPNNLPPNFFNSNSPRGVVFATPGTGFQVSANSGVAPIEFDTFNPTYSSAFQTFSPQRLFSAVGSPITDIFFFVPGSSASAVTSAFGAVFTDVDLSNTSSLTFFDGQNNSLGTFFVPAANNGLSFLGVLFNGGEQAARVRINSGTTPLGVPDTPAADIVVMDDFIYGEPVAPTAVAEPSSLLLLVIGFVAIGVRKVFHNSGKRSYAS